MSGKKKKIYHQKFGATYSYTKQITYTLPPTPKRLKSQLAGHLVSTKPKTNNKEKN